MVIKCGRCGKEIKEPNKENAKYIRNISDKRTWGVKYEPVFSVIDDSAGTKETFKSLEEAHRHAEKKIAGIRQRGEQLLGKDAKTHINNIRVVGEIQKTTAPKTLIVCPDCVHQDDEVIW